MASRLSLLPLRASNILLHSLYPLTINDHYVTSTIHRTDDSGGITTWGPYFKYNYVKFDFSFIPGNVAPGLLFRKPNHFENYDDRPFLWGQNEGTIAGNTQYIIFGSALKKEVRDMPGA